MYTPKPIDTSSISLTAEMAELVEPLARNTHEVWARRRISNGWRFGTRRDDNQKEHPDLMPYDQLSDAEKQLDRETVSEVLKVVIALGYRIERQ
jgi:hypothetical protein